MDQIIDKIEIVLDDPSKIINVVVFLFALWLFENRNKVFNSIFNKEKKETNKDKLEKISNHRLMSDLKTYFCVELNLISLRENEHLKYSLEEKSKREYLAKIVLKEYFKAHYDMLFKIKDDTKEAVRDKDVGTLQMMTSTDYWIDYLNGVNKLFKYKVKDKNLNEFFLELFEKRRDFEKSQLIRNVRETSENQLIQSNLEKIYMIINHIQHYVNQMYNGADSILQLNGVLSEKLKNWEVKR